MNISYELGLLRLDHHTGTAEFIPLLLVLLPFFWWFSVQIAGIKTLLRLFGHIGLGCLTNLTFWLQYSFLNVVDGGTFSPQRRAA